VKTYDLAVIGSGPGGYVAALRAGILGLRTLLIEKDPVLGGTCLHRGCIPTKALLHTAFLLDEMKNASMHGVETNGVNLNVKKTHAYKKKVVRKLSKGIEYLMKKRKVDVMKGTGKLLDSSTIAVGGDQGEETIKTTNIIVATGSVPADLADISTDGEIILNSDHILELEEVPKSLAIIGAGAVGVEFASIFNSFGSEVHLIELLPRVLPFEDEEISNTLEKALATRGIKVSTSSKVEKIERTAKGAKLLINTGDKKYNIEVEKVLLSVGRKPATADAGLEQASIESDGGYIKVNEFLQTTVPNIYAIGDIVSSPQLAHIASAEGILAVNHMAGKPCEPINYTKTPSCTYSNPEVASMGLKEKEAREKGYDVVVGRFPFTASGKASIVGETEGLVKIVAEKKYDEILGIHIVGPKATEMIAEAGAALNLEATVEAMTRIVHAHPTLSEAMMEAAHNVYGEAIHF